MSLISIKEPCSKNDKVENSCIGVDFGTTNSVCSIKIGNKVEFIKDQDENILIPSIVLFDNQKKVIGNTAIKNDKDLNSIKSIKRNFTENFDENLYLDNKGEKVSSVDIATDIFKHLKENCDNYLKEKIYDCVLTVPAYFDEKARSGIMRSAFMSGFNVKRLINEPTAAAFAYGLEKNKRGTYFVFDLGGGTFDVSILKLSEGIFKVIGSGGDSKLGGDDFDKLLAEKILKDFFNANLTEISIKDQRFVINKCKILKEKISDKKHFDENFVINDVSKNIKITSDFFNSAIDSLIDKTLSISESLLSECNLESKSIDGFILVGGSTRLYRIEEKIKKKFGIRIFNNINPDLVVSFGAALHGYELLNGSKNLLLDVTPLSLGIETMGGLMEKIISRNSSIPCVKEQSFTTHENGQTAIKINILQGERETIEHNRSLGEFILTGLEPKPAGVPRINVRFSLDADGILFVSANDENSSKEGNLVVKADKNLSIDEMRKIVESSVSNAQNDMNERMNIEAKIKGRRVINEIESVKGELKLLCNKNELKEIMNLVKELNDIILSTKTDIETINDLTDKINESTKRFAQKKVEKDFSQMVGKDLKGI
ncbi:MAG: Chaperone protein HscA [Alphaproteobacteria bacterium MarineAlpha8_Bin1]|nr:MAG: Chaperone protein HscA [Alphaproteobacteria bacterium MarineAlpha8_Bin1]